jgi:hypothetical protein
MNIFINKCKISSLKSRITIREHFEVKTEHSIKSSGNVTNNIEKLDNVSMQISKRQDLVLYNNTDNKNEEIDDKSGRMGQINNSNFNSIFEKDDEMMDEFSPRRFIDEGKTGKIIAINDEVRKTNNNEVFENVEYNANDLNDKDDTKYLQLENETKLITNMNNLTNMDGARQFQDDKLMNINIEGHLNQNKESGNKIQGSSYMSNLHSEKQQKEMKEKHHKSNSSEIISKVQSDFSYNSEVPRRKASSASSKNNKNLISPTSPMNNKNSFKLSCIFSIIQISEVLLFNTYILFLYTILKGNTAKIGICLSMNMLIYAISNYFLSVSFMKYTAKGYNAVKWLLKVTLAVSTIITLTIGIFIYFISTIENLIVSVSIFSFLFFTRNILLTVGSLNSYNVLITLSENSKLKKQVNFYHTYFSTILKAIFSFSICSIFTIILNESLIPTSFFFVNLVFGIIPAVLLGVTFFITKCL